MDMFGSELFTKKQIFVNSMRYAFNVLQAYPVLLIKAFFTVFLAFLLPIYMCLTLMTLIANALYLHVFYQYVLAYDSKLLSALGITALLLAIIMGAIAFAGILRFFFELHDRENASIRTLFSGRRYLLRFIGLGILLGCMLMADIVCSYSIAEGIKYIGSVIQIDTSVVSIVTMISLIIGTGIILFIRFTYALYTIVDVDSGLLASMHYSYILTQGSVLLLLLLHLIIYFPLGFLNVILEKTYTDNLPFFIECFFFQVLPSLITLITIIISLCARVRLYRLLQARHPSLTV